jgi:hypothetical protein
VRKFLFWHVVFFAVIVLICAYLSRPFPLLDPSSGINWDNAERIQKGMSVMEAEQIIGEPPRMESTTFVLEELAPLGTKSTLSWLGADCDVHVHLDQNRLVISTDTIPPRSRWRKRLLYRLGL